MQLILKGFIADYNELRPKGTHTRLKRMSQIQQCWEMKRALRHQDNRTKSLAASPKVIVPQETASRDRYDNTGHILELEDPSEPVRDDRTYLDFFDSFWESTDAEQFGLDFNSQELSHANGDDTTSKGSWLNLVEQHSDIPALLESSTDDTFKPDSNNDVFFASEELLACEAPSMPDSLFTDKDFQNSRMGIGLHQADGKTHAPAVGNGNGNAAMPETAVNASDVTLPTQTKIDHLSSRIESQKVQRSELEEVHESLVDHYALLEDTNDSTIEAKTQRLIADQIPTVKDAEKTARPHPQVHTSSARRRYSDVGDPTFWARSSRDSTSGRLAQKITSVSSREKISIDDILTRFSASTLSSHSTSSRARCSIPSFQEVEDTEIGMRKLAAAKLPSEWYSDRIELPGDFITSRINNFSHHLACDFVTGSEGLIDHLSLRNFCAGCCSNNSANERIRFCVPFAVHQFKQGLHVNQVWFREGVAWIDRFGNSTLHIAAALGATYLELRNIIDDEVSVHEVNTAGQTFMHVLNPCNLSVSDMLTLGEILKQKQFDFGHLDVLGQTFLEPLKDRGLNPLEFVKCWLKPAFLGEAKYWYAKRLFESSGGSEDQWESLNWAPKSNRSPEFMYSPLRGSDTCLFFEKLLEVPKEFFILVVHFEDHDRNNCLHLTASAIRDTTRWSDLNHVLFKESRLALVQNLLEAGVGVNHHNKHGETPLMTLIRSTHFDDDIMELLAESGVDVNARNNEGETALHVSSTIGNVSATKRLLNHSANVHVRDNKGNGILHVARHTLCSAKCDTKLYARITACIALAIDAGAIASPNLFHQWSLPEEDLWRNYYRSKGMLQEWESRKALHYNSS